MTIAVSGANGFTGRFVCLELLRRQYPFVALLRPGADPTWMLERSIPVLYADLNNSIQLQQQLVGCTVLLNVASIGFGSAPSILRACQDAGVKRAVFVSTTAIFTQLNAPSKAIRQLAESCIHSSNLATTILRPTMIFGTPSDRNMIRLIGWLKLFPLLPVFGDGQSLQQPVYVRDVAWAIVEVLQHPSTIGKSYNISGASVLSYNDVVHLVSQALGRFVFRVHIPALPVVFLLQLFERLGLPIPIKAEQILRLNEDKVFPHDDASRAFGYFPTPFASAIQNEVHMFLRL
jgi:nucleoside-diphosphate-sugar epimerase